YWKYDRGMEPYDSTKYSSPVTSQVEPADEATREKLGNKYFYELSFSNKGGLVMPIIIEWTFKDGTKEIDRIPAQIWRLNENKVKKGILIVVNNESSNAPHSPAPLKSIIHQANAAHSSRPFISQNLKVKTNNCRFALFYVNKLTS